MTGKRVLFLGLGDLGSQVFDMVVRVPGNHRFLVGGRNVDMLRQRTNVSTFTAMQLGLSPDVSCTYVDVWNVDQTADTISQFQPDIIFCAVVFDGLANNTDRITHAPGPNGLPGGYPIQVNTKEIRLVLPHGITLDTAIQINEIGLRFDGIEKIEEDGTVIFAEEQMAVLKETLGYSCKRMPLSETEYWAKELQAKYALFADKYH